MEDPQKEYLKKETKAINKILKAKKKDHFFVVRLSSGDLVSRKAARCALEAGLEAVIGQDREYLREGSQGVRVTIFDGEVLETVDAGD